MTIYTKLQENYNWFSQEFTQKLINPKMGSHLLFIGRKRKSQNSSRSGTELSLTRLSVYRPKCAVDRAKSCKTAGLTGNVVQSIAQSLARLQDLLEMLVDRLIVRPNWILFLVQHRSTGRSTDFYFCACRSTEPLA